MTRVHQNSIPPIYLPVTSRRNIYLRYLLIITYFINLVSSNETVDNEIAHNETANNGTYDGKVIVQWKIYIKRWMAYKLYDNQNFIGTMRRLFHIAQNIWSFCFSKAKGIQCGGNYNGLCGLIDYNIENPDICEWTIHAHHSLCLNISVIKLPASNPFAHQTFKLVFSSRNSNDSFDYVISKRHEVHNVLTNSSDITVNFAIRDVDEVQNILISFQVSECKGVSLNEVVLVKGYAFYIPNNSPHFYSPMLEITEYHLLVRIIVSKFVKVIYNCRLQNQDTNLQVFDGPSSHSPMIRQKCSNRKRFLRIKASTFQAYLIFRHYRKLKKPVIIAFDTDDSNNDLETFSISQTSDTWFSWDFSNSSSIVYRKILVTQTDASSTMEALQYKIYVDPSNDGAQGYLCQYGGLMLSGSVVFSAESQIGPICTRSKAAMVNDIQLASPKNIVVIILYHYGISYTQKGAILFQKLSQKYVCFGVLNPCNLCELSMTNKLFLIMAYASISFKCVPNQVIHLGTTCITVIIIANENLNYNVTCEWSTAVTVPYRMQISSVSRRTGHGPQGYCDIPYTKPQMKKLDGKERGDIRVKETSRKYFAMFPSFKVHSKCSLKEIFVATIIPVVSAECDTPTIHPVHDPNKVTELIGTCFIINITTSIMPYIFNISFMNDKIIADMYPSHFFLLAYVAYADNSNLSFTSLPSLYLSVTDNSMKSDWKNEFNISSRQMPIVWQSQGQYLTVQVSSNVFIQNSISVVIHLIADFEHSSIPKYEMGHYKPTFQECPSNGTHYTIKTGTCFSIHQGVSGRWTDAQTKCQQRGGYLWSVNNGQEWANILRHREIEMLSSNGRQTLKFPSINADIFLPRSSVLYLGLKKKNQTVSLHVLLCEGNNDNLSYPKVFAIFIKILFFK